MSADAPPFPFVVRPRTDRPLIDRARFGNPAMTLRVDRALEVRLPATVQAVPSARHQVSRWLSRARVPAEIRDELALVVTELVTNAIEASPGTEATIQVRGRFDQGPAVVLEVIDHGSGFELTESPELPGNRAIRGRGLPIVNALMDRLAVERKGSQTVVAAVRDLGPNGR